MLVQTQAAGWKVAAPEQLAGAQLYPNIAKSGYLFHDYSSGMHKEELIPCNLNTKYNGK